MRIVFRTDASVQIGTGHVMRCLTLADALRAHGAESAFICRPHAGHLLELISQRGHLALPLPALDHDIQPDETSPAHGAWLGTDWRTDANETRRVLAEELGDVVLDWLVVDHYALDKRWEQALRTYCRHIMVIDDLADRPHDCDLLLDQNLGRKSQDYRGLLKLDTLTLIGTQFALLRPEFALLRSQSLARRAEPSLKHLLITMGGVDKDNATGYVLEALKSCPLPSGLQITVVMGPHSPWLAEVKTLSAEMPWPTEVRVGVSNMAQLMADCDLAIGAAGSTSWERCCLGVPSLVVVLAANQKAGADAMQKVGAAIALQSTEDLVQFVRNNLLSESRLLDFLKMGQEAAKLTDGAGTTRVIEYLMGGHD